MRDSIHSRAVRIARVLARNRWRVRNFLYHSADYRIVAQDGTLIRGVGNDGAVASEDVDDDVLMIDIQVVEPGQFYPNPKTHCFDGTPIPYDVLNEEGIEQFREANSGNGIVFFDKNQSEVFVGEHRKWMRIVNPPPEFSQTSSAVDEPQGQLLRETAPVASFEVEEPGRRLSPELAKELDEIDAELKEHRMRNPVKVAYEFVEKWLPPKEKQEPRHTVMPPKVPGTQKKKKVWSSGPPPDTEWARMIAINKAKRAEYQERKKEALDEQRELNERYRRETRVTD